MEKKLILLFIPLFYYNTLLAQDTTLALKDSLPQPLVLEKKTQVDKNKTEFVSGTFKSTRLINGHSVETTPKGIMDLRISHRFGTLNNGAYQLFGLDNATMRLGFDFGLSDRLMVGVGRSTFEKTFDAFFKLKILRQSTGSINMPFTLDFVPTVALKTLKWDDTSQKNY